MSQPHTLIATVGTSLLGNLRRPDAPAALASLVAGKRWSELGSKLAAEDPSNQLLGAEINTFYELIKGKYLAPQSNTCVYCHSDTEDGMAMGQILKAYFDARKIQSRMLKIADLQDKDPGRFRVYGLRNLAREIGREVRDAGGPREVIIDATGGYKAQIAVAVMIGQALGVNVYYKHERFSTIIPFPPMPLTFDESIFDELGGLLAFLAKGELIALPTEVLDGPGRVLFEEAEDSDGKTLWELAPIGQIYLDSYFQRHPKGALPPNFESKGEKKKVTFGNDHHYPDGFKQWAQKLAKEVPFVISAHSIPNGNYGYGGFVLRDGKLIAMYQSDYGARLELVTTASSDLQRRAALAYLIEHHGV